MKSLGVFALVLLLLSACNHQEDGADRQLPPGIWVVEGVYPSGGDFTSTITVAPDGAYRCQIVSHDSSNVARNFELEGTFRIQDGVLLDTNTKNSSTNARVPFISRSRILRMDERELVVNFEQDTKETVFKKIK